MTVYGFDQDDSYGYGGGFALAEVASVIQLGLTPATGDARAPGPTGCVEATGTDAAGAPVPDVRVDFAVAGANAASGFAPTGANGVARYCWRWRDGRREGRRRPPRIATALRAAHRGTTSQARDRRRRPTRCRPTRDHDARPRWLPRTSATQDGPRRSGGGAAIAQAGTSSGRSDDPEEQEVKGESSASDLVLGCTERLVVLEDVVPAGSKVRLVGVADRQFAGRTVSIVFVPSGKVVAKPKVAPDGSFVASAPLPPKRLRNSNLARYEARIGSQRSLKLKLVRRMRITTIGVSGGKLVVTGTVTRPLAVRKADRAVELQRRVSCTRDESVATAMPRADGSFRISVAVPRGPVRGGLPAAHEGAHRAPRARRAVNTFTLPRGVNF